MRNPGLRFDQNVMRYMFQQ